jgi:hypothetical protein
MTGGGFYPDFNLQKTVAAAGLSLQQFFGAPDCLLPLISRKSL